MHLTLPFVIKVPLVVLTNGSTSKLVEQAFYKCAFYYNCCKYEQERTLQYENYTSHLWQRRKPTLKLHHVYNIVVLLVSETQKPEAHT